MGNKPHSQMGNTCSTIIWWWGPHVMPTYSCHMRIFFRPASAWMPNEPGFWKVTESHPKTQEPKYEVDMFFRLSLLAGSPLCLAKLVWMSPVQPHPNPKKETYYIMKYDLLCFIVWREWDASQSSTQVRRNGFVGFDFCEPCPKKRFLRDQSNPHKLNSILIPSSPESLQLQEQGRQLQTSTSPSPWPSEEPGQWVISWGNIVIRLA